MNIALTLEAGEGGISLPCLALTISMLWMRPGTALQSESPYCRHIISEQVMEGLM